MRTKAEVEINPATGMLKEKAPKKIMTAIRRKITTSPKISELSRKILIYLLDETEGLSVSAEMKVPYPEIGAMILNDLLAMDNVLYNNIKATFDADGTYCNVKIIGDPRLYWALPEKKVDFDPEKIEKISFKEYQ